LNEEFKKADLIISHAGAASILESLSLGKKLIVVPNEKLMNNHQIQLCLELSKHKFLKYARGKNVDELRKQLLDIFQDKEGFSELKKFPPNETKIVSNYLTNQLKIG